MQTIVAREADVTIVINDVPVDFRYQNDDGWLVNAGQFARAWGAKISSLVQDHATHKSFGRPDLKHCRLDYWVPSSVFGAEGPSGETMQALFDYCEECREAAHRGL